MINNLKKEISELRNPTKALLLSRFFKTGKGQYGEGDKFHGINVPNSRILVKKYYKDLDFENIAILLNSEYHEERLIGVLILVERFKKSSDEEKKYIYSFYLKNSKRINNWDLVDLSAPNIVGSYLLDKNRKILYKLVQSNNIWERRISVLATFAFIGNNEFEDALKIAKILLNDKHDLIHKATGWMLREVGKRNEKILTNFLDENVLKMPRTMLRYSIEKFDEKKRKYYLNYGR